MPTRVAITEKQVGGLRRTVFGVAMRILGSREDAEDITQEVMLRLFDARESVRYGGEGNYARAAARNACVSLIRHRISRRELPLFDAPSEGAAADPTVEIELASVWAERLAGMPEACRVLLTQRYVQRMEPAEIAAAMGVPASTIRVRLFRARRRVRQALEKRI